MLTGTAARRGRPRGAGKLVHGRLYVHREAWPCVREALGPEFREEVDRLLGRTEDEFNVLRLFERGREVAFLCYPAFFEDPFPRLTRSRRHKLADGAVSERRFGMENPPVLHRKELLLAPEDPRRRPFEALTRRLEAAGLLAEPSRIGYLKRWQERLVAAGFESILVGASRGPTS